jgi:hypothetical protein
MLLSDPKSEITSHFGSNGLCQTEMSESEMPLIAQES